MVSPILGWRSAVATTSILMLPATKNRPMLYSQQTFQQTRLCPDFKLPPDGVDVVKQRQSGFVAKALDFVGRGRARKIEMVVPAFARVAQIGIDIGAVEHVAGAVGIEHPFARNRKRRQRANGAGLVIPEQAALSHGD